MDFKEIHDGKYVVYRDGMVYSNISKRYLTPTTSPEGYLVFGSKLGAVHRLIADNFLGGIPSGMVVNHIDGDKANNSLDNLEIVTPKENALHAYQNGLSKGLSGEDNSMAKLSNTQAVELARLLKDGATNDEVAEKFDIHPRYVSLIRHGKRWSSLSEEFGPFPESNKEALPEYKEKYQRFTELKDTMTNKEIASILNVDPSTVSRWRSGQYRNTK